MRKHFCTICGGIGYLEVHELGCPLCQWYQAKEGVALKGLLGDFTPALQEAA